LGPARPDVKFGPFCLSALRAIFLGCPNRAPVAATNMAAQTLASRAK